MIHIIHIIDRMTIDHDDGDGDHGDDSDLSVDVSIIRMSVDFGMSIGVTNGGVNCKVKLALFVL